MAEKGLEIRESFEKNKEGLSLWTGIVIVLICAFFFAERFGLVKTDLSFSAETKIMFFAILALISGIIHIVSTIGTKYD